jgi:anti-sigma B factor antagonist
MELEMEHGVGYVVIGIPVETLDAKSAPEFKNRILPLVEEYHNILIDMSRIQFIDSMGLSSILACFTTADKTGSRIRLFGLTKKVQSLFEVVRIHWMFDAYPTKKEALASLNL